MTASDWVLPGARYVLDLDGRAILILGNALVLLGPLQGRYSAIVSDLLGLVKRIALFGANHFASHLPDSSRWFVWDKRPGMRSMDFADCELCWCSTPGPARAGPGPAVLGVRAEISVR